MAKYIKYKGTVYRACDDSTNDYVKAIKKMNSLENQLNSKFISRYILYYNIHHTLDAERAKALKTWKNSAKSFLKSMGSILDAHGISDFTIRSVIKDIEEIKPERFL